MQVHDARLLRDASPAELFRVGRREALIDYGEVALGTLQGNTRLQPADHVIEIDWAAGLKGGLREGQ